MVVKNSRIGPATANEVPMGPDLKSPKLTELVADWLRSQIIRGELKQGDSILTEPELTERLGVSRPTLREALSVLEAELLIKPRRGSRSGAVVQAPSVELSARYMGFLLQYRGVTLADVYGARLLVEPPLAGMTAAAAKKNKRILSSLEQALAVEEAALDDPVEFGHAALKFHETTVVLAGNETLALTVQQYDWVMDRHLTQSMERRSAASVAHNNPVAHRAHQRFVELVRKGTTAEAEAFWRSHVAEIGKLLLAGERRTHVIDLFE